MNLVLDIKVVNVHFNPRVCSILRPRSLKVISFIIFYQGRYQTAVDRLQSIFTYHTIAALIIVYDHVQIVWIDLILIQN